MGEGPPLRVCGELFSAALGQQLLSGGHPADNLRGPPEMKSRGVSAGAGGLDRRPDAKGLACSPLGTPPSGQNGGAERVGHPAGRMEPTTPMLCPSPRRRPAGPPGAWIPESRARSQTGACQCLLSGAKVSCPPRPPLPPGTSPSPAAETSMGSPVRRLLTWGSEGASWGWGAGRVWWLGQATRVAQPPPPR